MHVTITKLTDHNLARLANYYTSGRESHMSLETLYKHMHSPARTQIFAVELCLIPTSVSVHLVRHWVDCKHYVRSARPDHGGEDFEEVCDNIAKMIKRGETENALTELYSLPDRFDRNKPVNHLLIVGAEELVNISRKRLCAKAENHTRKVMQEIKSELEKTEPELAAHLVPECIHCGFCREPKSCGLIKTDLGGKIREQYLKLFLR